MIRTPPRLVGIVAALALALGMTMPSVANDVEELAPVQAPPVAADDSVNELPHTWFVELSSQPAIKGTPAGQLKREKDAFRASARAEGLQYTERFAYDTLFNGVSITLDTGSLARLQRVAGVKAIWPVVALELDPTTQIDPDLATALSMTGADVAQSELGFTGAGVKVAVMDTGIDYAHPDLGGCFGSGCRVAVGWDFVGDAYNADPSSTAYEPVPAADNDPDDCNGHGTHVAGIVGANGDVVGVAPSVTFGAYRVFGCAGSTTADIMMAAMERAHADGMDVLNMSIGSAFQWPQYPTAVAADSLVDRGVVVVASIGNSGANGLYSTGAPGNGGKVIGVASFDNTHSEQSVFIIDPDGSSIPYGPAASAPAPPTEGSLPMSKTGTPTSADDACAALPADHEGKAVLIRRGTCTFHTKALNAQNAGAAAVVLYNNVAGAFSPTVAGSPSITIPVVAITGTDGAKIDSLLNSGSVELTWTDETALFPNPTGGLISSFSSYGLAPDLSFKPNIGAPGGLIRSTYPLELGGYATVSGTSMSSPHVAGAAALYLEAHPQATPSQVKVAFQNTADPKNWWGNPALGFLDNAHRQGAGMLDVDDAIMSTAAVTPSELALGESQAGPQTRSLTIANGGPDPVTYTLGHTGALSTRPNTFTPGFTTGFAGVGFSAPSVTVAGGSSATFDVTITANPTLADRSLYGGYLTLAGSDGSLLRVPYGGFKGDYQSIVAMPIGATFPTLARLEQCTRYRDGSCTMGGSYELAADGEVYTLEDQLGTDDPQFLLHFDHQVRELRFEVLDANSGRNWGRMATLDYFGRNSTATGFFAFGFDGELQKGRNGKMLSVSDGTYVMRVSILKALGDGSDPSHWETWTSQEFVIDRP